MQKWISYLKYDPLSQLISSDNKALVYFTNQNLLGKTESFIESLWDLSPPLKVLNKQQDNGSWKYPTKKEDIRTQENYNQIETYRQVGYLIEKFGFNKNHSAIERAAEFLFSFQTEEGDFRGIYANQYSPNYSAAICELLNKAGYEKDKRIKNCLEWLLSFRQDDGGWAIPIRTNNTKWQEVMNSDEILEPRREKPSSHMVTGVVLRGFASHPEFCKREEIKVAGQLLADSLYMNDRYPDRKDKSYWLKFTFPYWFTDLLSALDSLYFIGIESEHPNIQKAIDWFKNEQRENGLWDVKILKPGGDKDIKLWMSYLISLMIKRYSS